MAQQRLEAEKLKLDSTGIRHLRTWPVLKFSNGSHFQALRNIMGQVEIQKKIIANQRITYFIAALLLLLLLS